MEVMDLFEKARFSSSLWASTDKAVKDFSFSFLIFLDWRDVLLGLDCFGVALKASFFFCFVSFCACLMRISYHFFFVIAFHQ